MADTIAAVGIPSEEAVNAGPWVTADSDGITADSAPAKASGYIPAGAELGLGIVSPGIVSAEVFGVPLWSSHTETTSAPSAEAFGTPVLSNPITAVGIPSEEALGDPSCYSYLGVAGIPSAEAFGTFVLTSHITAIGVPPEEAVNAGPWLTADSDEITADSASVEASGYVTAGANFGLLIIRPIITSAEAFGTPTWSTSVYGTGVQSAEAFGTPVLSNPIDLTDGIPSEEAFGTPLYSSNLSGIPGIPSEEAFGTPSYHFTAFGIGIPSEEAFGTLYIRTVLIATSVPTSEVFGTPEWTLHAESTGIPSSEAFGTATMVHVLDGLTGIPTAEALGTPSLSWHCPTFTQGVSLITGGQGPTILGAGGEGSPIGGGGGATILSFPSRTSIISTGGTAIIGTGTGTAALSVGGPCTPCPEPEDPEVEVAQAKRVDFISDYLLYRGEADPGTADSSALWRIRRVTIGTDDDVTEEWADGTAEYTKVWNNRLSYSYS